MTGKLDGQVAVVTGGSAGIGLASARALAEEGASVVVMGRRAAEARQAAASLGPGSSAVAGDVTRAVDLDRLFAHVAERHGGLDMLVCSAGGVGGGPVSTCTPEAFDELMALNVKSVFFTVQKAIPLLRSPSAIVVIGSVAGEIALPGGSVYCASKGAVRSLVRAWAAELAGQGVRVNLVGPGITDTPLVERIGAAGGDAGLDALIAARAAIKRRGRPEEVAAAVRFLCSPEASYITGTALYVDGGMAQL